MMKRLFCTASGILLVSAVAAGQQPAGQKIGLATSLQRSYATIKNNLTGSAEKMPEADYGSKPSTMPEVRTFGKLFGHVANAQFNSCAAARGVPNPNQGNNLEMKTTKAEFIKALADSFAFCDAAFASLTDQSALEMVRQGQNEVTRAAVLANMLSHSNEMYGTSGVYLRAKNIVPPSTEGSGRGMGGGGAAGGAGRGAQ
jgi:hypothetical protein